MFSYLSKDYLFSLRNMLKRGEYFPEEIILGLINEVEFLSGEHFGLANENEYLTDRNEILEDELAIVRQELL